MNPLESDSPHMEDIGIVWFDVIYIACYVLYVNYVPLAERPS